MTFGCVIACYGDQRWHDLAWSRAYPSTHDQGFDSVRVIYVPDGTLAYARNLGAADAASSDWLVFLDADDELAPGYVDAMRARLGAIYLVHELLVPQVCYVRGGRRAPPKYWPHINLRDGNWLVIGTAVERRLFEQVGGFSEDYELYEDWAMWARCCAAGAVPVEAPGALYIAHVQPKSRNRRASQPERLYWHQRIGHDVFPERYEELTDAEHEKRALLLPNGRPAQRLRLTI